MTAPAADVPPPGPREALDVVRRLEVELLALERAFAALDTEPSAQQSDMSSSPPRGEVGRRAAEQRADHRAPLTPEDHRRLKKHLDALLDEVRQLTDFLASG